MSNPLTRPPYADKRQQGVDGLNVVAVKMSGSPDGTSRTVALFTPDGKVSLGTVYFQSGLGWSIHQQPAAGATRDRWATLADAARGLAIRLDCVAHIQLRSQAEQAEQAWQAYKAAFVAERRLPERRAAPQLRKRDFIAGFHAAQQATHVNRHKVAETVTFDA